MEGRAVAVGSTRGAPSRRVGTWVVLLVAWLLLGACVDAEEPVDDGPAGSDEVSEETDLAAKPDVSTVLTDDRGEPPSTLQITDVVEGEGDVVEDGDVLTVHYVGVSWTSGTQFDATWDRNQPYSFTLGAQDNIDGWNQGLQGMRPGGRRVVIIPPDLAYGDRGSGPDIAPGETIAFVVDLLEVEE